MNTATLSVQRARALAAQFRTSRHHGRGWSQHTDRDLVRESQELYLMAQATAPRLY
ncbi:hypothetical protein [Oryzobacter terrae]|uniref:hypothetical protein n=1 Tax=Oryzobacter terrae TaxID=1620385 RepID=UPI0036709DDB